MYFNPLHYRQMFHTTFRHFSNSSLQFSNFGTNHCMFCNLLVKSTVGFKYVCMIYTLFNNFEICHTLMKKNEEKKSSQTWKSKCTLREEK